MNHPLIHICKCDSKKQNNSTMVQCNKCCYRRRSSWQWLCECVSVVCSHRCLSHYLFVPGQNRSRDSCLHRRGLQWWQECGQRTRITDVIILLAACRIGLLCITALPRNVSWPVLCSHWATSSTKNYVGWLVSLSVWLWISKNWLLCKLHLRHKQRLCVCVCICVCICICMCVIFGIR